MKRILISARDLKIGGIEKSLINFMNYLLENNYDITLVLEEKEGNLLKEVNESVKIITYTPSKNIRILRKIINLLKRLGFIIRYRNKFDISISFTTYLKSGSFVARVASKNSILWCHADYLSLFKGDKEKVKKFFEELYYDYFSKIVFVSKKAQRTFLDVFPMQKNTYFCNNLVDYKKTYKQAQAKIDIEYDDSRTTFVNIGRHDETQKKLTRIIEAARLLKKDKYKFRIIFVGNGKDTNKYKKLIKNYNLQNYIIFVGEKENPYPYYKIANCVIISSDYEGYPVVFLESYVLNRPIITTNVSDYEEIENKKGIVTNKNIKSIYNAMRDFIDKGFTIKEEFDVRKYNQEVINNLKEILNS